MPLLVLRALAFLVLLPGAIAFAHSGVAVLQVGVQTRRDGDVHEGCGPRRILARVGSGFVRVGEEGDTPRTFADAASAARMLDQLKRARPERGALYVAVDDAVEHDELIAFLDAAKGMDLLPILELRSRIGADHHWTRAPPWP